MQMVGTLTDYWVYKNTYVSSYDYKVPFWWSRMMEDPWYVEQLKSRWTQYREGSFSNEHIEVAIDSLVNHLKVNGALDRNNQTYDMFGEEWVWPVPNFETVNTYEKEINNLKSWLQERIIWLDKQFNYTNDINSLKRDDNNKKIIGYYNLHGIRIQRPPFHGVYIIRYHDGSFKKITTK